VPSTGGEEEREPMGIEGEPLFLQKLEKRFSKALLGTLTSRLNPEVF
jgi:hypothetical protein